MTHARKAALVADAVATCHAIFPATRRRSLTVLRHRDPHGRFNETGTPFFARPSSDLDNALGATHKTAAYHGPRKGTRILA